MYVSFQTLVCVAFSLACSISVPAHAVDENQAYQDAVSDAVLVKADEISNKLRAINKDNLDLIWNDDGTRVLVSTWKSQNSFDSFLKDETQTSSSEDYAIWVTAVPQVRAMCAAYMAEHNDANAVNQRRQRIHSGSTGWV